MAYICSIVGGILLVGGLCSVLWGKSKETMVATCGKVNSAVEDDDADGDQNNHHKTQEEVETTSASIVDQV